MRIDQLPIASSITNNDTLPVNVSGTSQQLSIGFLTNAIRDNVYGAPLTASTSSAMTDQTRVYVYTGTTSGGFTKGHWYYYNGSAWTDGGAYNSSAVTTDTTLTLSGVPADSKATGDKYNDILNVINPSTSYPLTFAESMHVGVIADGVWAQISDSSNYRYAVIPVSGGEHLTITNPSGRGAQIAALSAYVTPQNGDTPSFSSVSGWTQLVTIGTTSVVQTYNGYLPSDAQYLYIALGSTPTYQRRPTKCIINEYDYAADLPTNFSEFGDRVNAVLRMDFNDYRIVTIPNNTDYDTIQTPGNYKVLSSAAATSMTHCPAIYAHRLFVLTTTAESRIAQIVIENSSSASIYSRYYNGTNWSDWGALATKSEVSAVYTKFDGIIDPDNYTGTDSAKLASAIAAAGATNNSIIVLRRMYSLTENLLISHNGESNALLTFVGIGTDCGFSMAQYCITSLNSSASYGMVAFENVQFTGTNVIFNSAYLIRLFFNNCAFNGGNYVVYSDRATQSYYFDNCVIREIKKCVIYGKDSNSYIFDVHMSQCIVEKCKSLVDAYLIHGVFISQCCIEGFFGAVFVVRQEMRGFVVDGCYLEQNNDGQYLPEGETNGHGLTFDFSRTQGNIQGCVISNNRFLPRRGDTLILLRSTNYANRKGLITIRSNWIGPGIVGDTSLPEGCKFVKVPDGATAIYDSVIIDGNAGAVYDDPNNLLIDRTYSTIAYTHTLGDSDNLNNITEPGYYYWGGTGTAPTNSPSTSAYYVQHIRSNDGFAQLAITTNGVKSRIGTGNWT